MRELNLEIHRNDNGTYQSTGGFGYTRHPFCPPTSTPITSVPGHGWAEPRKRPRLPRPDRRNSAFGERRLLSRFGRNGYGCCEAVRDKLPYIKKIHNLRRVSVSLCGTFRPVPRPWATGISSPGSAPFLVSLPGFSEADIRLYLRRWLPAEKLPWK